MNDKLKEALEKDPELKKAYEADIQDAKDSVDLGTEAGSGKPLTKAEMLKKKAPKKPKCFKKYPKKTEELGKLGCRGCFWAQVCKGKVREDKHLEKMFG